MHDFFKEIAANHVFNVTLLSWFTAQTLKVFLGVLRTRRFDFRWFIGTGGMPSAHSAGSTALAVVVGQDYGFDSPLFALAAVFAMVTMFDAQGVRRSSGKQAIVLNRILDDIYWKGKIQEDRLKELLGHTPVEVFMGSVMGVFLALNFHR